jgi:hypothetical protein
MQTFPRPHYTGFFLIAQAGGFYPDAGLSMGMTVQTEKSLLTKPGGILYDAHPHACMNESVSLCEN